MLTGRKPNIQSKLGLTISLFLKLLVHLFHNLQDFIRMSLLAKDTKSDIARTQRELDSANEKLSQGVNLKEEQLAQIREYQ